MEAINLTKSQARKIIIDAAGLSRKAQFGTGIEAFHHLIEHLGFVQLDTNYVVERAHHHVMFARIPDYEKAWLGELVADGLIYEYLTAEAGFLPMKDFRFSLVIKAAFKLRQESIDPEVRRLMKKILDQVERDGAVMVGDFENDRKTASQGWWDWRPAKIALEKLYLAGNLMINRDHKFHKIYDVPLNLVPSAIDVTMPSAEEFARFMIRSTLGALGICSVKEMAWRARRVKGNLVKSELEKMVAAGEVKVVAVAEVKGPLFMLANRKTELHISNEVFILSPFDILTVFRHRLKRFFNFDYQIECFVPAPKRLYGYFSLPILAGEIFIARMDAKADRKRKVLLVHNMHFEEVVLSESVLEKLLDALKAFVVFNECRDVTFAKTNQPAYLDVISAGFA